MFDPLPGKDNLLSLHKLRQIAHNGALLPAGLHNHNGITVFLVAVDRAVHNRLQLLQRFPSSPG